MHFRNRLAFRFIVEPRDSLLLSELAFDCPESLDPFALCRPFSCALGGRHATDYYGSAAPAQALVTSPPTLFREPEQVPALLAQQFLRQP
jgi:hypothetical protein